MYGLNIQRSRQGGGVVGGEEAKEDVELWMNSSFFGLTFRSLKYLYPLVGFSEGWICWVFLYGKNISVSRYLKKR